MDPRRCPLCGQANACGRVSAESCAGSHGMDSPCWCQQVDLPRACLDALPPVQRGQACICRACVEQARAALAAPG